MANPTREEIDARAGQHPMDAVLDAQGITPERLARQIAEELDAEETKIVKVDGNVTKPPKGTRVVAKVRKGKYVMQTVLAVDMRSWGTQQRARQDVHRLRGHYPAEKHDHNVTGELTLAKIIEEGDGKSVRPPHLRDD